MKTPKRAEAQVGFLAAQSKQVLFSRRAQRRLRTEAESGATSLATDGAMLGLSVGRLFGKG